MFTPAYCNLYFGGMKTTTRAGALILCLSFALMSFAQVPFTDPESEVVSSKHIQRLKDGVLLVRLESNQKKFETITKALDRASNPKDSLAWAMELEDTMIETAQRQYTITDAVSEEYRFSDVAYFMDFDTRAILDRTKNPLKADLKTEVTLDSDKPVYILFHGHTPESKIDGYVILNSNLNNIPRPFPNNVSTSGLAALFGNDYTHIRRLNGKLFKYYQKVMSSQEGN